MLEVAKILKRHQLRLTASRKEILQVFLDNRSALSQPDVEEHMGGDCDRVTIYRTLTTFMEKGILHKVLDDSGVMRYAVCSEACKADDHKHDHIHFKCTRCGQTICIEQAHIPQIALPKGYQMKEVNVLMQGVCAHCNE